MTAKKGYRGKKRLHSVNVRLSEVERAFLGKNPSKKVRELINDGMKAETFLEHMGTFVNGLPEKIS